MTDLRLTRLCKAILVSGLMLSSVPAMAALPFTTTLTTLKNAIAGPFLLAAAMIMIVVTCIMLAFGEWGDGFKKLINIALWLSIAFGATSFINSLFSSSIH